MKLKIVKLEAHPHQRKPVRIVADGAIGSRGIFGGHIIPVLILDTSERPDIEEVIRVHSATLEAGDMICQWGELNEHKGFIALIIRFVRPIETMLILEFDIAKQGIFIEQALTGRGLYLQAGREGDRYIHDIARPKVLMEIPDTGFRQTWDSLFHKYLTKEYRARGLGRAEAKRASKAAIVELRRLTTIQMKDQGPQT